MMKFPILSILFLLAHINTYGQHDDIIYNFPKEEFHINNGDYYWIENGVAGEAYYFISVGNGYDLPLPIYGRFGGTSGKYLLKPSANASLASGKITIISKDTHFNRNKYNKHAKGALKKKYRSIYNFISNIYIDENGCEWELQPYVANKFHDPDNNLKFLHKIPGGGEYETIVRYPQSKRSDMENIDGPRINNDSFQSSYNFGHTTASGYAGSLVGLPYKHKALDMSPHEEWNTGKREYEPTKLNTFLENCRPINSTLLLFDLSGSMNDLGANSSNSKLQEAKEASRNTLKELSENKEYTEEVSILGFSGECTQYPIRLVSDFEQDLTLVSNRIDTMSAAGATPLTEALESSIEIFSNYLKKEKRDKGKLILLSDGVATCDPVRPLGVYNSAKVNNQSSSFSSGNASDLKIKYYTIGFNLTPGSPAERDLQYIADISGGKYLSAQNQSQLQRAFRKFNTTYVPKSEPALLELEQESIGKFNKAVVQINAESFEEGLKSCEEYFDLHSDDCHGVYNLALMQEANDSFRESIANYQKYLGLCPSAYDSIAVVSKIKILEKDLLQYIEFQKQVVISDLDFIKIHFERIQNGDSVALAEEFKGFLNEKGAYYLELPTLVATKNKSFVNLTKDISNSFEECASMIFQNPTNWDRDAVPIISMLYLNLEDLVAKL